MTDKAVILARGLGTRMKRQDTSAVLTSEQAAAAKAGCKGMMPISEAGWCFLDYSINALADAGYRRICLVIAPGHDSIKRYYAEMNLSRVSIDFAIQEKPLGTADAVAAAEAFADGDPFTVLNSDNIYPACALNALTRIAGASAIAGYHRESLISCGNIPADRVAKFAVVGTDASANLVRIIEKPTDEQLASLGEPVCVSMNSWLLRPAISTACRAIKPSERGELELTSAVQYAIDSLGESFKVLAFDGQVLDLSGRGDIEAVKQALDGVEVNL